MVKATSYICEHTAEFVLVPALKSILSSKFGSVTPIFPWITREGSRISFMLHGNDEFKMVGLFPRRPKLRSATRKEITVKVNEQVLYGALSGSEFGIPVVAGCPIASDFWELGKDPNCLWINLDKDPIEDFEIKLELNQSSYIITHSSEHTFGNDRDLITYVDKRAKSIDLNTAIDAIRTIRTIGKGVRFYYFMGGYKPVYFLLK